MSLGRENTVKEVPVVAGTSPQYRYGSARYRRHFTTQSFLGSLNYYSRYLEDYAIYASILYELEEVDYHVLRRLMGRTGDTPGEDPEEN